MKKLIALVFFASVVSISFAQVRRNAPLPSNRATDSTKMMATGDSSQRMSRKQAWEELNLTKEQKDKMKEIMQAAKVKKEAITSDSTLSEDERTNKMRELRKETMAQTDAILTDEQKARRKELRRQGMRNRDMSMPVNEQ